jgi:tetratricopeptide (TPR) repeat protein
MKRRPPRAFLLRFPATLAAACLFLLCARAAGQAASDLDAGFHAMYETKFTQARATFLAFARAHPTDPLGPAAEAASYLYQEFYAQGVFTSEFFLDDKRLLSGVNRPPDSARRWGFLTKNREATTMAEKLLEQNPNDAHALFVLTITEGMQADYLSLVEKRQFESLRYIRRAEHDAERLLAVDPHAEDAYVALGAAHYIIGCLPGYKRFFLRLGGIRGDRERGMAELQLAAARGRYLRPFAESLLALAALREHQPALARQLFAKLSGEFPENPVFTRELQRLDKPPPGPPPKPSTE